MICGNLLIGESNNLYSNPQFFEEKKNVCCRICGKICEINHHNGDIDIKKLRFDFSFTYEGVAIVSRRFRDYCISNRFEGILFIPLTNSEEFYYFEVIGNSIRVDEEKSMISKGPVCSNCGYYSEVIGGQKIFLHVKDNIENIFFHTNIYWRTHNVFGPLVIIGLELTKKLKAEKFRGLFFKNVYC